MLNATYSTYMQFSFLQNISLPIVVYILFSVVVVLLIWVIYLEIRLKRFMTGKDGKSLEDSIIAMTREIEDHEKFKIDSIDYLKNIEARLRRSLQAVETIRFNPFKGTGSGGNQSFSTAFMNEKGDGVVISSLYSRDHVSVFSKPVKKFQAEFETTTEEKTVLNQAKESLAHKST